jgi:hypothetical protein
MSLDAADCLSEDQVLSLAAGGLSGPTLAQVELHLDRCEDCRMLVAAYAGACAPGRPGSGGGTVTHLLGSTPAERPAQFVRGDTLAGRYHIIRMLGAGGMGEVYEALDRVMGEKIALKTVAGAGLAEADLERFTAEAQLARKVTHSNVCRAFDIGFHEHRPEGAALPVTVPFLTMELLAGETLRAHVQRVGKLTGEAALPLIAQMAAALDAAHAAGIVHLDFKSDNVMLVPQPAGGVRVVVMDFGLARRSQEVSAGSGRVAGTVGYMAPEQLQGRPSGTAADIWALGVVIYELLTGRLPFTGSSPFSVAVRTVESRFPGVRLVAPALGLEWQQVIDRCLQVEPGRRFERAGQLVRDLRLAAGAGHRRRLYAGASAALVLGAVVAARALLPSGSLPAARAPAASPVVSPVVAANPGAPAPAPPEAPAAAATVAPPDKSARPPARTRAGAPGRTRAGKAAGSPAARKPQFSGPAEDPSEDDAIDPFTSR